MKPPMLLKVINFYGRLMPSYSVTGYLARRATWGRTRLDFTAQRWVVTGASGGIGRAIARAAAAAGAEVVAVARESSRLHAIGAGLAPAAAARVTPLAADLSLRRETAQLVERLGANFPPFDVLINNAGILLAAPEPTDEGLEASFTVNLLSHYQLTEGLLTGGHIADRGVIVNMSSGGMYNVSLGLRGLLQTDPARYSGKIVYARHKRAQVALTDYWNARYGAHGIRCYVTHPGWARTEGVRRSLPVFAKLQGPILRTPRQGGDTALWLCHERPTPVADSIWFDRRPRATHLVEATRKAQCTVEELVEFLDARLQPI